MLMRKRIGLRQIRSLQNGKVIWDAVVPGFGARRQHGRAVSYFLYYRTQAGRQRWFTIGRHGAPYTPDTAREAAKRILGDVAAGSDPAAEKYSKRKAATVAELCDMYIVDVEAGRLLTSSKAPKKPTTIATDKGRIERHIKPLLGGMSLASVTSEDVETFMYAVAEGQTATRSKTSKKRGVAVVRGGKGTASRTVALLGAIFSYAVRHRMCAGNPVRGVRRFADGRRDRRLNDSEYQKLGVALRTAEATQIWSPAVAAIRFLALTGWRRGEVLSLRPAEIDLNRRIATLTDTKTGRSVRPLSRAACDLLRGLINTGDLLFPSSRSDGFMAGFQKIWLHVANLGGLPSDVTSHTLRHSFASLAADLGYSESTIAALLGHKSGTITSRYIHTADAVLLAAADAVANRTAELMGDRQVEPAQVLPFRA